MNFGCNRMVLLGLVTLAGSALPVLAQDVEPGPRPETRPDAQREPLDHPVKAQKAWAKESPKYRSGAWLMGKDVVDSGGKEIAEVKDLIIDRGSGKIEYAVLSTKKRANADGRTVTVPFTSLSCNGDNKTLALKNDGADLAAQPTFDSSTWKEGAPAKSARSALDQKLIDQCVEAVTDPYAGKVAKARTTHIEGKVEKVERVTNAQYGEQVVVTVKQDDGTSKTVALGPSWYVNSASVAPMRDDTISFDAYELTGDASKMNVASGLKLNGQQVSLRDAEGKSVWSARRDADSSSPRARYALASSLKGAGIECRGQACGKVDDLVLDTSGGRVAFLSIDPNENFLGIADTKRMVPWSVASVTPKNVVRLDASKEMILEGMETPKDLTTLPADERFDSVYRAYKVERPMDDRRDSASAGPSDMSREAWGTHGVMLRERDKASMKTLSGTCQEQSTASINSVVGEARILRLKTDDGVKEIVIGPAWHVAKTSIPCGDDSTLVVKAWPTTVDGRKYWVAQSVTCRNQDIALIDDNGNPEWSR